jgi:hypothetical protein
MPETTDQRRHLPPAHRRRRAGSSEPGRANGGDSHIQRDRLNPYRRLFGSATTRAHRERYSRPRISVLTTEGCRYRAPVSTTDDLALLPPDVAGSARVDDNGEVWWHSADAERAVNALANAGLVILGLDLREYDAEGRFFETAWSALEPTDANDVELGRSAALAALARPDRFGNAVLITWRPAP